MGQYSCYEFWIFVLYSLPVITGQSQLISSPQPITAKVGDDVTLPCRLDPPISATSRAIEWTKPGLDPEYIHVHQDGRLVYQSQNPLYNYRTALFVDQLINGNVSLKLYRVKTSDAGKYRCFIPSLWKEAFIHLSVGEKAEDCKEDSPVLQSSCAPLIAIIALLVLLIIIAVVLLLWIWRRYKTEVKMLSNNTDEKEKLMMESNKIKDLKKEILKEELQKKEEDQRNRTQVIETLRSVAQDLNKQKGQITSQLEGSDKLAEETELRVRKVDKEVTEKGGDKTANKAQGYLKFKEILQETSWNQEERRKELQQLLINTEELLKKTLDHANKISEEKNRVEGHIKEIKRQIEETENQRGEGRSEKGGGI